MELILRILKRMFTERLNKHIPAVCMKKCGEVLFCGIEFMLIPRMNLICLRFVPVQAHMQEGGMPSALKIKLTWSKVVLILYVYPSKVLNGASFHNCAEADVANQFPRVISGANGGQKGPLR